MGAWSADKNRDKSERKAVGRKLKAVDKGLLNPLSDEHGSMGAWSADKIKD